MLEPIMNVLSSQKIILASSSPRRQEILRKMGLKFEVIPSLFEEEDLDPTNFKDPADFVIATAENKVKEVEERLNSQKQTFDLIIGADTIVYADHKVLGKPKNEEQAFSFLKSFSNNEHLVYTGVVLRNKGKFLEFSECTKVKFGHLTDAIIWGYLKTEEYKDKAGGYGIQDKAGSLVEEIQGDPFNIIGLPLHHTCKEILKLYSKYPAED